MESVNKDKTTIPVGQIKFFIPFYIIGILFSVLAIILFAITVSKISTFSPINICDWGKFWDLEGFILSILLFATAVGLVLIKKWGLYLYIVVAICPLIFSYLDNYAYEYCRVSHDIASLVEYFAMFILFLFLSIFYFVLRHCYKKIKKGEK